MSNDIPKGYMMNSRGHLIPESMITPIDKLRDHTVNGMVNAAKAMSRQLSEFKAGLYSDVVSFIAISAEEFDVQWGGKKGNVSLVSFDGRHKVVLAMDETIEFNERLQVAKQLIDECLTELSVGAAHELQALVSDYFQVDSQGKISTTRILSLRRHQIQHAKWEEAMRAINASIVITGSKTYLRLYERDERTEKMNQIPLDIASA